MKLYQMSISHYCEKIRWALAFKNISYQKVNLLPGMHIARIRKLTQAKNSSVPVLEIPAHTATEANQVIQNSSDILDYLESHFPANSLMPSDPQLQQEVRDWEAFADQQIGPHVRRCCYHILLQHKKLLVPMLSEGGPWYANILLTVIYPKLTTLMRQSMAIHPAGFAKSQALLDQANQRLESHLQTRDYLVGDQFTRADLAVAALLAPLSRAPGYGIDWPSTLPPELAAIEQRYQRVLHWVNGLYEQYR